MCIVIMQHIQHSMCVGTFGCNELCGFLVGRGSAVPLHKMVAKRRALQRNLRMALRNNASYGVYTQTKRRTHMVMALANRGIWTTHVQHNHDLGLAIKECVVRDLKRVRRDPHPNCHAVVRVRVKTKTAANDM